MEVKGLTDCFGGCGTKVEYIKNKRIYCDKCRLEKKRAVAREFKTKQRIAKGIKPVKGVPVACSVCGVMYERMVIHSHRCKPCQAEARTMQTRLESRKRKTDKDRRDRYNAYTRKALALSPNKRISAHFSTLIHRALGKNKAGRSWKTFVDYTLEELMAHLERQFLPGMSWDNKGDWHIDHIIPRSSFEYESPDDPEFKQAWALTNLRPLWAVDNIRKNASRQFLL